MPPPHPPTPHHHPHSDSNKWLPRSLPSQGAVMIVIQIRGNISFFSYFCAFGWKHTALQEAGQCNWTMSQAFKCVDSVFSSLLQDCRSIVHIVAPQLPKPEEFPNESSRIRFLIWNIQFANFGEIHFKNIVAPWSQNRGIPQRGQWLKCFPADYRKAVQAHCTMHIPGNTFWPLEWKLLYSLTLWFN